MKNAEAYVQSVTYTIDPYTNVLNFSNFSLEQYENSNNTLASFLQQRFAYNQEQIQEEPVAI